MGVRRIKAEAIYKRVKEDNEEIKAKKAFPDGWDDKVYDYYNKLSAESYDVELFMNFLSGDNSPLEMAYAYRRNLDIMFILSHADDSTVAFVDDENTTFYIVSKDKGGEYLDYEWDFLSNISPIRCNGEDDNKPVPKWLIREYEECIK